MVRKWGLGSNQILLAPESFSRLLQRTRQAPTSVSLHLGQSAIRRLVRVSGIFFPLGRFTVGRMTIRAFRFSL